MNYRRVWTPEEDQIIQELVLQYGFKNWAIIASKLTQRPSLPRTGKQCRQRWHNHLNPSIEKKSWSEAEEKKMFELHKLHGNKWTVIAESLSGRTDNCIKNYFYSTIRRSLRRMGKFVGSKNSTGQMKKIKPSTLSKIFVAGIELQKHDQLHPQEKQLFQYIKQNCENLRDEIVQFITFKPKRRDFASTAEKQRYEEVICKMVEINDIYEKMKEEEKRKRKEQQMFQKDYQPMESQSEDDYSSKSSPIHPNHRQPTTRIPFKTNNHPRLDDKTLTRHENTTLIMHQDKIVGKQLLSKGQEAQQGSLSLKLPRPIKSQQNQNGLDESGCEFKEQEVEEDNPQFNIEFKDDFNTGYFFNTTPSSINLKTIALNPYNHFYGSTPKIIDSNLNSLQALSSLQNSDLNDYQISIRKEIEVNSSKQQRKVGSSLSTIASPGSAFRYCGIQ